MNRGRARQTIFHSNIYYQTFLTTLAEAQARFQCVIHANCLMGNHYHLLISTPNGNLGRIMRHINGVYTQRYNRLRHIDGPLFRGRYKAILVDQDNYLLQLSRYIHRNPIDMKQPLVTQLDAYPWSSYPAYIGIAEPEKWLELDTTYRMLNKKNRFSGYSEYVLQGVDKETKELYKKGNITAVIGNVSFKKWVFEALLPDLAAEGKSRVIQANLVIQDVVNGVAVFYGVDADDILKTTRGPQPENQARKVAMYLCQELSAAKLIEIAQHFNLSNINSVSCITHQVRKKIAENQRHKQRVNRIIESLIR